MPYDGAWQLQNQLSVEIASAKRPPTLLLLEHPHTYTFGRRGKAENLLWDEAELALRGIAVHWVDRGGDVTYRGPGQLLGYPPIPLSPGGLQTDSTNGSTHLMQADYLVYLRKLERVLIKALAQLGVVAEKVPGLTGVWVRQNPLSRAQEITFGPDQNLAKIAAIGVKVDVKGISRHGFALNVKPDMSYWEGIVGCGLKGYQETRLAGLLDPVPLMTEVTSAVVREFGQEFEFEMKWLDTV